MHSNQLSSDEIIKLIEDQTDTTIKIGVRELIDIYKDNWQDIIESELRCQFSTDTLATLMPLTTQELNLLKRVVNETSLVYKTPAERVAVIDNGTEKPTVDKNYEKAIADSNLDLTMRTSNKYTNLLNHTLIKVVYRDKKLDYDILTFDNCEIITHPDDWKMIVGIKYYIGLQLPMSYGADSNNTADKKAQPYGGSSSDFMDKEYTKSKLYILADFEYEDEGEMIIVKQGKIYTYVKSGKGELQVDEENIPYRDIHGNVILPFVLTSKEVPVSELLDFTTGNDLRDLNINIAVLMVHQNALQKYQSYLQVWMKVRELKDLPKKQSVGPAKIIGIPVGEEDVGDIGVLDLQSKIKEHQEVIEKRITMALTNYGISPQNFTLSGSPQSGFSMKMSNIAKLEYREDQLPIYRAIEHKLFDVVRAVWNWHRDTEKISDEANLRVDFAEVTFPMSPEEKEQEFTFLKRNNVKTDIDLIMSLNPDVTEDEALVIYTKNKVFNNANVIGIEPQEATQPDDTEEVAE
jgi:hypothetical protein